MKKAIVTGITGQDGAYLSALLIKNGYQVIGLVRSFSNANRKGLEFLGIGNEIQLIECDLTDLSQVISIIDEVQPCEVYNLAAQSSVSLSFKQPIGTISFNIISVLTLLEAIRIIKPNTKFYQASTGEVFGNPVNLPIDERSAIVPVSPYAISKSSSFWITKTYRDVYGLFACNGFLFNHESVLRGDSFFVKKVIKESLRIKSGETDYLEVGNIDIKRDFGWAPRYVEAMYLMLQHAKADDYIISSNKSVSLRSIVEYVFDYLQIPIERLVINEKLYRPAEILDNYGDSTKARNILGWDYNLSFYDVLDILVAEEIRFSNGQQDQSYLFSTQA